MRRGILNVIWEDKRVLMLRGAAVTVEDVEVRKKCACLEGREAGAHHKSVSETAWAGGSSYLGCDTPASVML